MSKQWHGTVWESFLSEWAEVSFTWRYLFIFSDSFWRLLCQTETIFKALVEIFGWTCRKIVKPWQQGQPNHYTGRPLHQPGQTSTNIIRQEKTVQLWWQIIWDVNYEFWGKLWLSRLMAQGCVWDSELESFRHVSILFNWRKPNGHKVSLKISTHSISLKEHGELVHNIWKLVKSFLCAAVMQRSALLSVDCFIFASALMLWGVNKRVGSWWSLWCSYRNQIHPHERKQLWTDEILHRCSHFYPSFWLLLKRCFSL